MHTIEISDWVLFTLGLLIGALGAATLVFAVRNRDLEAKVDDLQWRVNRNNRDSK